MWLYCHVRLAHQFSEYKSRLLLVQARLQALSILIYSNALQESPQNLLYPGILEELVELIELPKPHLVEIRSAALRTLTAIIHLDRSPHTAKYVVLMYVLCLCLVCTTLVNTDFDWFW